MSPIFEPLVFTQERFIGVLQREPERFDAYNPSVSAWGYAEHADHVLKVNEGITRFLSTYKKFPQNEPNTLNVIGRILLFVGRLPRGKGKSPEVYKPSPKSSLNPEGLIRRHEQLITQWENLSSSEEDWSSVVAPQAHPLFGKMSCSQWIRFMNVHMKHHHRIVLELLD